MKLLKKYWSEAEAYIDKGMLADRGIESVVEENGMAAVFPAPNAGTGFVGLYVSADNYDTAKDLLGADD